MGSPPSRVLSFVEGGLPLTSLLSTQLMKEAVEHGIVRRLFYLLAIRTVRDHRAELRVEADEARCE